MAGGILGNAIASLVDRSGGILGSAFGPDNRDAMTQFGLGLMSGRTNADGWANAMQGLNAGRRSDMLRLEQAREQEERERRAKAAAAMASGLGLSPELAGDTDLVRSLYLDRNKTREPSFQERLFNSLPADQRDAARGALLGLNKETGTDDQREYLFDMRQRREMGQPVIPFGEWMQGMKRAGATSVNVGGGSDKQIFDTLKESADSARAAATGLNSLQEARRAVQGGATLGAFANERLALQKMGAALGVTDPQKIVNTETFRAAIAPQVAAMMKATVGSTQISNADREFAEKAAGGAITLDAGSINRLMDIMERASSAVLDQHQQRLDAVYPDGGAFARERALFGVQRPQPRAQQSGGAPSRADLEAEARRRGLIR